MNLYNLETTARQAALIKLVAGGFVRTEQDAAAAITQIEEQHWEDDLRPLYACLLVLTGRDRGAVSRLGKAVRPFADVIMARMALHYHPLLKMALVDSSLVKLR